ncbi:hypothetical protein PIB30_029264 [Stylosanthes scabra]|uniref:Uncharacterized protein n=1 Tax=Stylosanthes scabra TaxID=79078 RepID=A0ABU6UA19_9FABA|nr:hypothetical protein [Stylosanthes scabra]
MAPFRALDHAWPMPWRDLGELDAWSSLEEEEVNEVNGGEEGRTTPRHGLGVAGCEALGKETGQGGDWCKERGRITLWRERGRGEARDRAKAMPWRGLGAVKGDRSRLQLDGGVVLSCLFSIIGRTKFLCQLNSQTL